MDIFISYSSKNRQLVERLVADLQAMGHKVWFDQELTGGYEWWSAILDRIRKSDLIMLALTSNFLKSEPCKSEYEYALSLQKQVLPVALADVNTKTLPFILQKIQIENYQRRDKEQLLSLVKALNSLPQPKPLPISLPPEPEIPVSELAQLRDKVDALPSKIDEQLLLVVQLKQLTQDEDNELEAWELLEYLSQRDELPVKVSKEVKDLVESKPKGISIKRRLSRLEPREFIGHTSNVTSVAISSDAKFILSASEDFTARVWDTITGDEIAKLIGHSDKVNSIAISQSNQFAVTASKDYTARIWDLNHYKEIAKLSGHTDSVNSVAISPDNLFVVTTSDDETTRLWEVDSGEELAFFTVPTSPTAYMNKIVTSVVFLADSKHILVGGENHSAYLWAIDSKAEKSRFVGHKKPITTVAVSPDGGLILTGSYDHTVRLWDRNGQLLFPLTGHANYITSVAFSYNGKYALSGCFNGTARLWDLQNGNEIYRYNYGSSIYSVVFSPDDSWAIVGGNNKLKIIRLVYDT